MPNPPIIPVQIEDGASASQTEPSPSAEPLRVSSASAASVSSRGPADLVSYLHRQWAWSKETFGPALRTKGIVQHITKELREIEADPHDLAEWVDVIILAMDGFWRHGGKPEDLLPAMQAKQDKNFARKWPDSRAMGEDQAIEHDRSGEGQAPIPSPHPDPVGEAKALEDAALSRAHADGIRDADWTLFTYEQSLAIRTKYLPAALATLRSTQDQDGEVRS